MSDGFINAICKACRIHFKNTANKYGRDVLTIDKSLLKWHDKMCSAENYEQP